MSHGWTPERRAKQAEAIHRWKPWQESTGPKSPEGKAWVSRNGWKGGTRPMLRELARPLRDQSETTEATQWRLAVRHLARVDRKSTSMTSRHTSHYTNASFR